MSDKREELAALIKSAAAAVADSRGASLPGNFAVLIERPKREGQGDWATNAAMQLAKVCRAKPMELAGEMAAHLRDMAAKSADIASVEAAAPGFLNFTMTNNWIASLIAEVLAKGDDYGRSDSGGRRRVQVEFVSANPTGPIHLGHGRGAAIGDVMSSILEFSGWDVEREYYINDAGVQMDNLGKSTQSRYFALLGRGDEAPFPEDGYPGDYIEDIAKTILREHGPSLAEKPLGETVGFFRDETCAEVLKVIRKDLDDFGVRFNVWFSEKSLYEGDAAAKTIERLRARGCAYDKDGAVWFKATAFGDEKDRVLIKNTGVPTYFTSDIAYMLNKYERGFERLIYVWGADHHGYVPRVRAANEALGGNNESFEVMLIQFVSLLRNGEPIAMSKRAGTFITLRDVMDEVGRDAARFSFAGRKCDSKVDFDLEVAKSTSSDNPVYYVQYAHARICSLMREAEARGVSLPSASEIDPNIFSAPSEIRLAKEIARFPEEVTKAAQNSEPHRIAFYAADAAEAFHAFYNSCKILGEEDGVMKARLLLAAASRVALGRALFLLGVAAPERM